MPWQAPATFQSADDQEPPLGPRTRLASSPGVSSPPTPPLSVLSPHPGARGSAGGPALFSSEERRWNRGEEGKGRVSARTFH